MNEKDIIRDTIFENTNLPLFEAERIATLIRERLEAAANVFQEDNLKESIGLESQDD